VELLICRAANLRKFERCGFPAAQPFVRQKELEIRRRERPVGKRGTEGTENRRPVVSLQKATSGRSYTAGRELYFLYAHEPFTRSFAQKIYAVGFTDDCGISDSWPLAPRVGAAVSALAPLEQFDYGDVVLAAGPQERQLLETHSILMGLSDDSLLKPLRQMSGQPAPGDDLGGWYRYNPDYKWGDSDGFAASCAFGQWVSALSRMYAITRDQAIRDKVLRLNRLYAQTISGDYYDKNRFPTYCYDKIVCGLIDSHRYVGDADAFSILERTTNAALPHFPKHAVEHDKEWRPNKDQTWTWDESYTISENLFLAYQRGAGERYRELALQYLDDEYYDPLAENRNVLAGRHAYSYVNSLSSAM